MAAVRNASSPDFSLGWREVRLFLFGNNRVAAELSAWLRFQGEEFVGAALHPPGRRKFGEEILRATALSPNRVLDGSQLHTADAARRIKMLEPEMGISAFFGYIIPKQILELFPRGCINVHPAFLPFNRGAFPNVWSIVDGTPAGATIHWVDAGVDTGDIIAQREVEVEPVDTGQTLYRRLEQACVDLFQETWPLLREGKAPRIPQPVGVGTSHRVKDVEKIDEIELNRKYTARYLLDILRARTFPPYPGAYFWAKGRKVYVRVQLLYEEDLEK